MAKRSTRTATAGTSETTNNPATYAAGSASVVDTATDMGGPATRAGNDILRASLPIMTAARMNDLASQLLDGLLPKAEKVERGEEKVEKANTKKTPLPNGKMDRADAEKGERREEKVEKTNAKEPPLPNGKTGAVAGGRNGRNKAKNQWMQPLVKRLKKRVKKEKAMV